MSADVALQDAVYDALIANAGVSALVGARVFDNAPDGVAYPYITFGPSQAVTDDVECIDGEENYLQIDVWTQEGGSKRGAKVLCAAVKKALHNAALVLSDPVALVLVEVEDTRVIGDPNEKVAHGIVSLKAITEG
ncbi:DUF3168 domain-containing protein [Thioclava sp. DLFJ4-1]|uniref:DUF3168 domain-containing protein n=1 Tax=Thioclava sp. DLFJ4-1 TaxID=1915313 RepID=UPI00099740BB|nr:DUF3168 domain-containing protein [Thioclava sp. DLFJ4-1]OOY16721.1 hypothetical protein BMI85_06550 [Thioclava sp. DLFJ4-1]